MPVNSSETFLVVFVCLEPARDPAHRLDSVNFKRIIHTFRAYTGPSLFASVFLPIQNRLQLSKGENDTMWYKLVQEEKAKKLMGLT